jgi:hypothetical protein
LNAAVSKTVSRRLGGSRVRIPPPPLGVNSPAHPRLGRKSRARSPRLGAPRAGGRTRRGRRISHRRVASHDRTPIARGARFRLPMRRDQSYMCRDASIEPRAAAPRGSAFATRGAAQVARASGAIAALATRPRSSPGATRGRSERRFAPSRTPAPGAPRRTRRFGGERSGRRAAPRLPRRPTSGFWPRGRASSAPAPVTPTSPPPCAPTSRRCARSSCPTSVTCDSRG